MKLKRLSERRSWVSNTLSAQPSSWQVVGAPVYLIGEAGGMNDPHYRLVVGGEWVGYGVKDGKTVEHDIYGFKDARRAAFAFAIKLAAAERGIAEAA